MPIPGQADRLIPSIFPVESWLSVHARTLVHPPWFCRAVLLSSAKFRCILIVPKAVVFDSAARPKVVMELGLGRGVAHADVKSVAFELDGIDVAACERIVNVAATQSDSNSGT